MTGSSTLRTLRIPLALGLVLLTGACTAQRAAPEAPRAAPASHESEKPHGPAAPPAAAVATHETPVQAPPNPDAKPKNRDPHAEADVAHYIERLESPERVADLQIDVVLKKIALAPDADIGDLGCGPGLFALAFAKASPDGVVYASDIEPAQLDAVRAKIHAEHVRNVVPVLASTDDPHFPPARLDVIFIGDTYHHLVDRVAYMRRLAGDLKAGGRLVILDYKPGQLAVGPPPEHKLAAGVMEKELVDAGWTRVERFATHPYHDFEVWRVVQPWEKK